MTNEGHHERGYIGPFWVTICDNSIGGWNHLRLNIWLYGTGVPGGSVEFPLETPLAEVRLAARVICRKALIAWQEAIGDVDLNQRLEDKPYESSGN